MKPTIQDLIKCASRELAMRRRVYPKWIASERMTSEDADWEIRSMEGILEKLNEIADKDQASFGF